jgi:peptidoglycan/xylan/chitin deacetylase (PgdA/CDA1 family)
MTMSGNDYENNDHVALANDIEVIDAANYRILPLHKVVSTWLKDPRSFDAHRIVALTCDDGSDFDFRDISHQVWGMQRSMLNILRDFRARKPHSQPELFITSFVIVSPEARAIMDRTCMIGRGWWNDDWWPAAVRSGLMGIASHSWDHNHESLPAGDLPGVAGGGRGTFATIDSEQLADYQIRRAFDYLRATAPNPSASLFAYPYGQFNDYLVDVYLPAQRESLGITAALTDSPQPLSSASNRWKIPRYICGRDWKSPEGLSQILRDARGA